MEVLDPHRVVAIFTVTGLLGGTLLNNHLQLLCHQSANVLELLQQSCILVCQSVVVQMLSDTLRHAAGPATNLVLNQVDVLLA